MSIGGVTVLLTKLVLHWFRFNELAHLLGYFGPILSRVKVYDNI